MTPTPEVQERLRRYLLGQLADDAREEVEKELLASDEVFQELLMVEDELIDEHLSGQLDAGELRAFEKNFLATPERNQKLKFGLALNRYVESHSAAAPPQQKTLPRSWAWAQSLFSSPLRLAVAAVIVVGVAFGIWRIYFHQSDVDNGLQALNAAYREQRPVESRISGLNYAPFPQTRGGPERVDARARSRAEALLNNAVSESPNAVTHHAIGKVYLAKRNFDDAIREFDEALKSDPSKAQLCSDLGAAWLEKGRIALEKARSESNDAAAGNAVAELARSLEYFDNALKLDGHLAEALFNRALYHQIMRLDQEEEADWRAYLKEDPNSQWANEARHRLKLLEEQRKRLSESKEEKLERFRQSFHAGDDASAWELVSSYQNRSGNLIVEQLQDAYLAEEARDSKESARETLSSLTYAANLSRQRAGDLFFFDLVQFYARTSRNEQVRIAQARALIKAAHDGWGQANVNESIESFDKAKQLFLQSGDEYEAIVADYWIGFCYYRQNNPRASLAIIDPLILRSENSRYLWLLNRLFYLSSAVHFKLNEHSRAIDFANRAAELADRIHDQVGLINALSSLMEYHRYLGDYQWALSYVQRGFGVVDAIDLDPVQATRHYSLEAIAFASNDLFAASADYQRLALQFALQGGRSAAISSNYSLLGLINWKLGDYDAAIRSSKLAYDTARDHSNGPDNQNLMAYASLQMANAARLAGDCDTAIANYNRSLEIYSSLNLPTHLYQAHKGRLICYLARQNDDLATAEISKAISLVEKYRTAVFEENLREKFFDSEQNVYDTAIEFEYAHKNIEKALQYAENSRGRSLLDLINTDPNALTANRDLTLAFNSLSNPLSISEIRSRLPPDVQLIQYAVLEDKLLIWLVSRDGGVEGFSREITASDLTQRVLTYLQAVSSKPQTDSPADWASARELFDILIGPIASRLDIKRRLCMVPDKALNLLPFAALRSPAGKYLIEDYVLQISPSSTVFIMCSEIANQKQERIAENVLSVGNPTFDRTAYQLPDLPAATREAVQIASLYNSQYPLIEKEATLAATRRAMEGADVIHLALHSVLDERFPLRSKLLFAKTKAPEPDALSTYDVYRMRFSRTRLVVLSSCQTGAERYYKGEGMIGLARPFIAARVPLVVASLWPVESDSTADLMIRFHRHRVLEKTSTAEALARAQREMLSDSDQRYHQPYYWAPFTLIGGYARF